MNEPKMIENIEPHATAALDYPAAHSMDSIWWCVDSQGHVAQMNTGEAGAMPVASESSDIANLVAKLTAADVPFNLGDLFSEADGKLHVRTRQSIGESGSADSQAEYISSYLLWFRDEVALQQVIPPQGIAERIVQFFIRESEFPRKYVRLPGKDKVVVWIDGSGTERVPSPRRIRELLKAGVLLRAWGYDWGYQSLELELFGLFGYELNTFDNWIAGPYERIAAPRRPLQLGDLPASIRNELRLYRFPNLDFRREPLLQPFEHGEAHTWDAQWVSTTGRTFLATQHGSDLLGIVPPTNAVESLPTSASSLHSLTAIYLKGESGAVDVLNDFLEEAGQTKLQNHAAAAQRLDEVLFQLFAPEDRWSIEASMVEHVIPHSATPEIRTAALAAVDTVRKWLAGEADDTQLQNAAQNAMEAWIPDHDDFEAESDEEVVRSRDNGVAWAAWALARRWPLVPTRTARTVHPDELAWQMQLVLERL